jgi:hypothetical protein
MVVAAGIVGAVALHLLGESSEWLQAWAERDPQRAASILFALMTLGFSAPLFGLAIWLERFAGQIKRAGRYPPPEAKLTRDTRVRTGASALAFCPPAPHPGGDRGIAGDRSACGAVARLSTIVWRLTGLPRAVGW